MSLKSYLSPQAYSSAQAERTRRFVSRVTPRPYEGDDPVEFINREMVIPETGKPLILHTEQAAVLRAMSHKSDNENYDYSLWLYSAPKKSGKTTIGAAVALWQGLQVPDGQIYIIGNDQRQADNRMMDAIRYAINHNPRLSAHARIVRFTVHLDNGTRIESIPVDPKGEAGMNPTGLFWTEAWGAMGKRPELLWTEASLSPTRSGRAFKFVESYAGYTGESLILERLYDSVIRDGVPHESIPELYINQKAIGYWCTRRYMPWQVEHPEYYLQEAQEKIPSEVARIHDNQWASPTESFIPDQWWDACLQPISELGRRGVVLGVDAASKDDCFALVIVSREGQDQAAVRYCKIYTPEKGRVLDFEEIETEILRLYDQFSIVEVAYDQTQLVSMSQRLGKRVKWREFSQATPRVVADKRLYDMIRDRNILHSGQPDLKQHIQNADRKPEDDKLRIVKRTADKKIDAVIALSMAIDRVMKLNL